MRKIIFLLKGIVFIIFQSELPKPQPHPDTLEYVSSTYTSGRGWIKHVCHQLEMRAVTVTQHPASHFPGKCMRVWEWQQRKGKY